jgi:hypothetical protein
MQTRAQQAREKRYRKQLKACGFRSFKSMNERRLALCHPHQRTEQEEDEFTELQACLDLYCTWKTNDMYGRAIRKLKSLHKRFSRKELQ